MRQWPSELMLLEHPYFTRSKVRVSITTTTETVVNPVDTLVDSTTRESATVEENRTLRHVIAQSWQACANGQEPPTSIPGFLRSQGMVHLIIVGPDHQQHPQGMPFRNNPTVTIVAPVYTLPQPTVMQKAAQEGQFTAHPE
ncbi:hypothetical protein KY290_001423 [Solanum tuberosum]|uniref:Uncharacterized protein n=1 Tax=Solanum tuberosum TaxID=4113 RepID=A0ABQ7WMA4_SOLTU|nr:hypothetical protein KY285_001329 [Solanum tuberosum]KAH0781825.1 hypothetical protein KY290_001423 [Solanum tuberosum]